MPNARRRSNADGYGRKVVRSDSMAVGLLYHSFNNAVIGVIFGSLLGSRSHRFASRLRSGAVYGFAPAGFNPDRAAGDKAETDCRRLERLVPWVLSNRKVSR